MLGEAVTNVVRYNFHILDIICYIININYHINEYHYITGQKMLPIYIDIDTVTG